MSDLSREAMARIDAMVEQIARKAGFTGSEDMTYQELIQARFEQQYGRIKDFTEEIKTYLKDGLLDLIEEGYSEDEAMAITMEKFDEAELKSTFADFANALEGFGPLMDKSSVYTKQSQDIVDLFYPIFILGGMALGLLAGYLMGGSWLSAITGLLAGVFIGIVLALLYDVSSRLRRNKQV